MKLVPPRLLSQKVRAPSEFWGGPNQWCSEGRCSLVLFPVCSHGDESSNIPAHLWLCIWCPTFLQQNRLIMSLQMKGRCSKHWSQIALWSESPFISVWLEEGGFRDGLGSCLLRCFPRDKLGAVCVPAAVLASWE